MKIIHITAAYKPAFIYGGPTMSVAKLCEALVKENINIDVLTTTANGKTELAVVAGEATLVDGVQVTYFKRLTKDHTHFSPALLLGLKKIINQFNQPNTENIIEQKSFPSANKPQTTGNNLFIHIHAWWNLVSILSCLLAKWFKITVILSPRGMLTEYTLGNRNVGFKSIIHTIIGKTLLKYCHIHATSEKEKIDILKFIKPKSITVIPNLVELKEGIEPQVSNNQEEFKLIFLSRIEEKKGLELLFDALKLVTINWSLTIAGSGDQTYVENLKLKAEKLKLTNINWVGQVKSEDKFKLLANHDLLILNSYNENFANVVIESLSVGTPVLLSKEVGLADYVLSNNLGWITDLTAENIAKKIELSFKDSFTRKKIRGDAPKLIIADYNDETLVKKYINLYQQFS